MALRLDIVTPEQELFTGEVDIVLAPSTEGQIGILPHHAPLITVLDEGILIARQREREQTFAIHGGYMQVIANRVIVLADVAERAEEIDIERAQEARQRAEELLRKEPPPEERRAAMAALRRSLVRIRVAQRQRPYRPEREREQEL